MFGNFAFDRIFLLIQHFLNLMVIRDVGNLVYDLLAQLDLRDLLIFVVNEPDQLVGVDPHREVVHVEAGGVLLEVHLVLSPRQVSHDVAEAITVVEEP